eukprot:jgi/Mesen1/5980/ME000302S04982
MSNRPHHDMEYDVDEYDVDVDDEEADEEQAGSRMRRDDADPGSASESDEDADLVSDTSAAQARQGKDIQGIPWDRLPFTREKYRKTRLVQYRNYENLNKPEHIQEKLERECTPFSAGGEYFEFQYNTRSVRSTIVHFQLRNLVWATSKHDVYVMHHYAINHWSPVSRTATEVMNLSGPVVPYTEVQRRPWLYQQGVGRVQISTMCARGNLLVAGGFHGEMVCKNLHRPGVSYCAKITHDENAITNAIEIFDAASGAVRVVSSNNDSIVRVFDAETFAMLNHYPFDWPVNHTSVSPDSKVVLVVGDDPQVVLADTESGKKIASLKGHLDFSFASAWHPDGRVFATGNQDSTCRLWDIRYLGSALLALKGKIGTIRSIRFSSDGRFMAMAEPADFIHVFDTKQEYKQSQEIDLFGEIAGISFSPDAEALYVGMADRTYSSLLEFNRKRARHSSSSAGCKSSSSTGVVVAAVLVERSRSR